MDKRRFRFRRTGHTTEANVRKAGTHRCLMAAAQAHGGDVVLVGGRGRGRGPVQTKGAGLGLDGPCSSLHNSCKGLSSYSDASGAMAAASMERCTHKQKDWRAGQLVGKSTVKAAATLSCVASQESAEHAKKPEERKSAFLIWEKSQGLLKHT